jgi:MOSC domain-containing protein YiiM
MFEGTVISINITPVREGPLQSVNEVRAVPGRGLEGDRYFDHPQPDPRKELTLVEAEAIEAFRSEFKLDFNLSGTRRNVITRGVPLNHLVGKEFWIGEVKARGLQLCEPCATLQRLSHPKVLPGLVHRGGLRAQILSEGVIRVGETVKQSAD